jgi:dTDP-4-dehydrorhamnose 3,5-epimerase
VKVIDGHVFSDDRGTLKYFNDFDMSSVVRMYNIEPRIGTIRAWQGHKCETKWFYVAKGRFLIKTIQMGTFEINQYLLNSFESKILEIPGGYYNGIESLEEGSILIVYSDFDLIQSKEDDFRLSLDQYSW